MGSVFTILSLAGAIFPTGIVVSAQSRDRPIDIIRAEKTADDLKTKKEGLETQLSKTKSNYALYREQISSLGLGSNFIEISRGLDALKNSREQFFQEKTLAQNRLAIVLEGENANVGYLETLQTCLLDVVGKHVEVIGQTNLLKATAENAGSHLADMHALIAHRTALIDQTIKDAFNDPKQSASAGMRLGRQ